MREWTDNAVSQPILPNDSILQGFEDDYGAYLAEQHESFLSTDPPKLEDPFKNTFRADDRPWRYLCSFLHKDASTLPTSNHTLSLAQIASTSSTSLVPSLTYTSDGPGSLLEARPLSSRSHQTQESLVRTPQVGSIFDFSLNEGDIDDRASFDDHSSVISKRSNTRTSRRPQGRKIPRFTKAQTDILQKWLEKNEACPYPSHADIKSLAQLTNLEPRQVRNWFSRTRTRKLAPSVRSRSSVSSVSFSVALHQPTSDCEGEGSLMSLDNSDVAKLSLLACDGGSLRASSPPENLGLYDFLSDWTVENSDYHACGPLADWPTSNIDWWLETLPLKIMDFTELESTAQDNVCEVRSGEHCGRVGDVCNILPIEGITSATTSTSTFPVNVLASSTFYALTAPRKGRRRHGAPITIQSISKGLSQATGTTPESLKTPFKCSYCNASFGRKSSRKRHEDSIHAPKEVFVCHPVTNGSNGNNSGCPFCAQFNSICIHDFNSCFSQKVEADRTFFRRDGFIQHLKNVHKVDPSFLQQQQQQQQTTSLDLWRKSYHEPGDLIDAVSPFDDTYDQMFTNISAEMNELEPLTFYQNQVFW